MLWLIFNKDALLNDRRNGYQHLNKAKVFYISNNTMDLMYHYGLHSPYSYI